MYFLDARRGRSRYANFRVTLPQQGGDSAAVTPAQGDDLHSVLVCGRDCPEDVFRVSAGCNGEQDIARPAEGVDLPLLSRKLRLMRSIGSMGGCCYCSAGKASAIHSMAGFASPPMATTSKRQGRSAARG
jgi:hypothetical protein